VSLVIGLAAPDDEGHVSALATMADFLTDEGRRAALLRAEDPQVVRSLIAAYEGGAAGRSDNAPDAAHAEGRAANPA
jgi:hypothetical protein